MHHPIPLDEETPLETASSLRAESWAESAFLLLALTVLQRSIGFLREIFFCRWLGPEQLGLWDMAFGFLMMAGPLVVMSLPGVFGRYVERYRQRGQLRSFLMRSAAFCAALIVPAVTGLIVARRWFSFLVFGTADRGDVIVLLAATLVTVVAFNYLTCLLTALRNIRMVSRMELGNSIFFATAGLLLMAFWRPTAAAVVVAYGLACLLSVVTSLLRLKRLWPTLPPAVGPLPVREFCFRLLPFSAWIMVINLLWNLFDVADRYMIVHFWSGSPAEALAEVGNYRSSRVLPLLLSSITVMIAGMTLPHLSHDWESNRRDRVSDRLNLLVKAWAVLLTAGAAAAMFAAPLLFRWAFQNKYAGGLHVLPWTLTYCTWFGLTMLLQTYLWCAEKASMASFAALIGVLVNVGLNFLLLPRMGLLGAVLATTVANLTALVLMVVVGRHYGLRIDRAMIVAIALPVCIPLGPGVVALVLLAVLLEAFGSERYFSAEERNALLAGVAGYAEKLPWRRLRATPSA